VMSFVRSCSGMNSRKSTNICHMRCQLEKGTTNSLLYSLVYLFLISDDQNNSKIYSACWKIYARFVALFDAGFVSLFDA